MQNNNSNSQESESLGLRSGDWVEVRTPDEILATLDDQGCLGALPFMPEMLQYCGKRFSVFKSAHKACDTINKTGNRRMTNAVHLEGLRCDGQAHGGCQALCLLFWKEAWLKRVPGPETKGESAAARAGSRDFPALTRGTRAPGDENRKGQEIYRCQATELFRATTPLSWWDPRQYAKDLLSRNVRIRDFLVYALIAAYNTVMRLHWRGRPYPYVQGVVDGKTPAVDLKLQAGELVEVRSKKEIMLTISKSNNRNRGLWFDVEMVPFCGRQFRVLSRVDRLIDERTGKMIHTGSPCLILDGAMCGGCLSENRLFCPRAIYSYWHEIWLKRVEQPKAGESQQTTLRA
jgi:hypothetical protein